jgi:GntR family transcriptional regulator/MocR family aminotransferase
MPASTVPLKQPEEPSIGLADAELFPLSRWHSALRHALDRFGPRSHDAGNAGAAALRQHLADWLNTTRGLALTPAQLVVVGSRRHALHLITRAFMRPGLRALVEMPCDPAVPAAYAAAGARLLRIPVDGDGLMVERLPDLATAVAHVTAGHQMPLGVALAPERRSRLLAWAERAGAIVIEEDLDADFRSDPPSARPLAAMEGAERVIHVGSVAAAMGPFLNLAYLALPPRLVGAVTREALEDETGGLERDALGEFFECGAFARHVHRARKVYAARRHALAEARQRHFPSVRLFGVDTGLHQAWVLPPELGPANRFITAARRCGLCAGDVGEQGAMPPGLREQIVLMDVARCAEKRIDPALERLARVLASPTAAASRLPATGD